MTLSIPTSFALLIARIFASAIFILGGFNKLTHMKATVQGFTRLGVPSPHAAYWIAVAVEFGCGLLLLFGLKARFAAAVLAVFCLATAALAHADFTNAAQQTQLLKNLSMAGGFIALAVVGAGFFSIDTKIASIPPE